MALTRNLKNWFKGWLPKDPILPFPIKAVPVNRKIIDKKLLAGTITVSLIIVVFRAFVYSTFSQPIVYQYSTQVRYSIKEPQIEESLKPYVEYTVPKAIFNGTVDRIGTSQDSAKATQEHPCRHRTPA